MSQDTEREAFLPCPHCGEQPIDHAIEPHQHSMSFGGVKMPDHAGSHVVECSCGAGMIDETRKAVLARWNRRAALASQQAGKGEPVAAQHRFRHPQKGTPDWSEWQQCKVSSRPPWEIDSVGYEVEYRNLYTSPPSREVEPLTDEQQRKLLESADHLSGDGHFMDASDADWAADWIRSYVRTNSAGGIRSRGEGEKA